MDKLGFPPVSSDPPPSVGAEGEGKTGEVEASEAPAGGPELAIATEDRRAGHDEERTEVSDGHPGSEVLEVVEAKAEVLDEVEKICDGEENGEGGLSILEANRSSVNDVTVHGLPTGHLLAVGSVNLGHGDDGENRAELVAFAARTVDMSCGIDSGIVNQETETEIGVLVHSVEGMHLKDSISEASMVGISESIQGEDCTDAGEKQEVEPVRTVDDARTGPAAALREDSCLGGPVVQVKNSDSHASGNDQKEITDFDIHGSSSFTSVPVAEAESADGNLGDLMNTGDFLKTNVGSANLVVCTEPKNSEIQPAEEVRMTKSDTSPVDLGSVSGVLIAGSHSGDSDIHLVVENPVDKANVTLESLVFTKEGQDADICLSDNSSLKNRDFAVTAPIPAMVTSVPETSQPFEFQNLVSQGKENSGSASGVLIAESQSGDTNLVAENPNNKSHIVQENSILAKVVQDADEVPFDNTSLEKGGFTATDIDSVVDISVLETSTSFEIQNLASQGEENLGSVSGFVITESQSGNTHLVAENPNHDADTVLENTPLAKELQDANVGLLDDALQEKEDFTATDSNPVLHTCDPETSASFEIPITAYQGKEILGSVSGALIAEPQIGDTHLVVENPNDKADTVLENLASLKEAAYSDVGLVDNTLLDKGDFAVRDPNSVMDTSVPEASPPYEIQRPASQVSTYFSLGDSQIVGAPSLCSLADDSPGVDDKLESSPGRSRTDMVPNVLDHTISPLDECYNEFKAVLPEAEQRTEKLDDGVAEIITCADISQIEEQESLECADDHTRDSVAATPWTSNVQNIDRVRYYLPPQVSTELSISDLVWGKVKSHPWWPGQIVDPSNASEMAMKHQKKDNFLVAYFGDRTFAWRDTSQLKVFYTNFSQMEKQSYSEAFIYAVNDSLEEVSRRVELGLTCSCVPEENYADIKYGKVENAGIREAFGATSFNRSLIVHQFQPERLLEYISALAQSPTAGAHRLDLGISQAQLKAFYRSKGYPELTKFTSCGWVLENGIESSFAGERKPVENLIVHSTSMPSELIPVKRKRGRPRKNQKVTLESGGLIENAIVISSSNGRTTVEDAVHYSTPTSSEFIPVKRKRGRPPKNQQKILDDVGKRKNLCELMEDKNLARVISGSGRESGIKDTRISGSGSSGKVSKFDHPNSADTGKRKKKKLDLLQDIETSTSPLTLNDSFESGEGLGGSWKSMKEREDSSGDFQAKAPSSRASSSFKIGEYIRRVAGKLTGSSPILRCHDETLLKSASVSDYSKVDIHSDEFPCSPVWNRRKKKGVAENYSSLDELLSQLCLAATDPLKGYGFVASIVSFFTKFRNSIASDMSKPDYMKDSYWSDVISDNSSERRLLPNGLKRKRGADMEKQRKGRKPAELLSPTLLLASVTSTAQQLQFGALNMKPALGAERSIILVEEKIIDTPTALVLSFNSSHSLPSETDLIRIFSRYGPLKEEETEILRKSNRVKVVFKRRADAEIAFSSAGKFSIFGPALLSYRLRYLTSTSKTSPDTSPYGKCDALHAENGNLEVSDSLDESLLGNEDAAPAENVMSASRYFQPQGNDDAVPAEDGKLDPSVPLTTPGISSDVKNDALTMEGGDVEFSETGEFDTAEVEAVGQG